MKFSVTRKINKVLMINQTVSSCPYTLYTVPNAPEPIIPPLRSSDCFIRRILDMSGLALVGVNGCCNHVKLC